MSGNGIVVARSAKDGDITYTVFTDFGNIIHHITELDMLDQFEVIERHSDYDNVPAQTNISNWIWKRQSLINDQLNCLGDFGLKIW
jgi:hypothetical protein